MRRAGQGCQDPAAFIDRRGLWSQGSSGEMSSELGLEPWGDSPGLVVWGACGGGLGKDRNAKGSLRAPGEVEPWI